MYNDSLSNLITLLALSSPLFFFLTSIASYFKPGIRPKIIFRLSIVSSLLSMVIAISSIWMVSQNGTMETIAIGSELFGLIARLDMLSSVMFSLTAIIAFIVMRFSINYLDGDQRHGIFMGRLAATIASAQLLILSGSLSMLFISWVLTSMMLHRLLIFYHKRSGAHIAAKKKYIMARLGDISLFISFIFMIQTFETGNLSSIFTMIQNSAIIESSWSIEIAALFLVLAAVLKSAQFPTHGWLIEVMETPTPVSALLHAGLLNAGPYLILRFAFVMESSTIAPITLLIVGGLTSLIASYIYMTQTAVKTALGYSSVAHMGFSLMASAMGAYPAAMLHLIAHSFYKAHAFLSTGSTIDRIRSQRIKQVSIAVRPMYAIAGLALSLGLFFGFAWMVGFDLAHNTSILLIGSVIVMGVWRILSKTSSLKARWKLWVQSSALSLLVIAAFFGLESIANTILSNEIPEFVIMSFERMIAASSIVLLFFIGVSLQVMEGHIPNTQLTQAFRVHAKNGFYANAYFDKWIGALNITSKIGTTNVNYPASLEPFAKESIGQKIEKQVA